MRTNNFIRMRLKKSPFFLLALLLMGLPLVVYGGALLPYRSMTELYQPYNIGLDEYDSLWVDSSGNAIFTLWPKPEIPVPFWFNQNGLPSVNDGSDFAVLQESLQRWNNVDSSNFQWEYAGLTPISAMADDGFNVFFFEDIDGPSGILGGSLTFRTLDAAGPDYPAGRIVGTDIAYDAAEAWSLGGPAVPGEIDLLAVAVHELGHSLGLNHVPNSGALMMPIYQDMIVGLPFPFPDDMSIATYAYPEPGWEANYGSMSGRVSDEAGNPVWGAWITVIKMDGTRNPDGLDSLGAHSLLDGSFTIPRIPSGQYALQMGWMYDPDIVQPQEMGNFNALRTNYLEIRRVDNSLIETREVQKDYPIEYYNNKLGILPNTPHPDSEIFNVLPGSVFEDINIIIGIEIQSATDEEPNNTFDDALELVYNEPKVGMIEPIGAGIDPDIDFYKFDVQIGDPIIASVTALDTYIADSLLDAKLILYSPTRELIAVSDSPATVDAFLFHRAIHSGSYYLSIEDPRGVGSPMHTYAVEVDLEPFHQLPGIPLISPARGSSPDTSEPRVVIGMDLEDVYGDSAQNAYISKIRVNIERGQSSSPITTSDFQPMRVDHLSGVSLWRDTNGDGVFNFSHNSRSDDDEIILLKDDGGISVVPMADGFQVVMEPKLLGDGSGSAARLPSSSDEGKYDFYIVIRTSHLIQHEDRFNAYIPKEGLEIIDDTAVIKEFDMSYPLVPKDIICDIIHYVVFTNPIGVNNFAPSYAAHPLLNDEPQAIMGVNAWGNKGEDYKVAKMILTMDNLLDFEPADLLPINDTDSSGVMLFRDASGGDDGVYDPLDERIPIDMSRTEIITDATQYRFIMVPIDPVEIPGDDTAANDNSGADIFVVLALSEKIRDGDILNVQMLRYDDRGPVILDLDKGDAHRELTTAIDAYPRAHVLRISPEPKFLFKSLVNENQNDVIGRESATIPVLAINAYDYGSHWTYFGNEEKSWYAWLWDSIRIEFVDAGGQGNFDPNDLRRTTGTTFVDVFDAEPSDGVAIYKDDSTGLYPPAFEFTLFDVDGDGVHGGEWLDNQDDDQDGLTDEDVGDFDEAGIPGVFDFHDDFLPYSNGHLYPNAGGGTQNRYVFTPTVTDFADGTGFNVDFRMQFARTELHYCFAPFDADLRSSILTRLGVVNGANVIHCGEVPLLSDGLENGAFSSLYSVRTCRNGNIGTGDIGVVQDLMVVPAPDPPNTIHPCIYPQGCRVPTVVARFVHGIGFPDDNYGTPDNPGPNWGDDFFVAIRTSATIAHNDDFKVRLSEGAISYSRYEDPIIWGLSPKRSNNFIETPLIKARVDIVTRLTDLTEEGQVVAPGGIGEDPVGIIGLNLDLGGSKEGLLPTASPESLNELIVEIYSPVGTPAEQRIVISNSTEESHLNPIGDGDNSGILFFQDNLVGRGRDGLLDVNGADPIVSLVPLSEGDITGSGTVNDPYRIRIELAQTITIYYDDYTGGGQFANGNDYYVAIQPSANMPPDVRFKVRLSTANISGTAPLTTDMAESNELRSAVPTKIRQLIKTQTEITDSELSPKKAIFALDVLDLGTDQKLNSIKLNLIPIQPSEFPGDFMHIYPVPPRPPVYYYGRYVKQYTLPGNPAQISITFSGINISNGVMNNRASDRLILRDGAGAPYYIITSDGANNTISEADARNMSFVIDDDTVIFDLRGYNVDNTVNGYTAVDIREFPSAAIPRRADTDFKPSDIMPITTDASSGLALYKDVDFDIAHSISGVFDASDEFVAIYEVNPNDPLTLQPRLDFAAPKPDVPDTNEGNDQGADYFLVMRTSPNMYPGDAFAIEIPPNGISYDPLGPSPSTSSSAVMWGNRLFEPTLVITAPQDRLEPGDPSYIIEWSDTDPDEDNTLISLYYMMSQDINEPTAERTLIVDNLNAVADGAADRFTWDTTDLDRGEYFVIGVIRDNEEHIVEVTSTGSILLASDVAQIVITAPSLNLLTDSNTATDGEYVIRWSDGDQDDNTRLRLFYDDDNVVDNPNGFGLNYISNLFDVTDRDNRLRWRMPVNVLEDYDEVYIGAAVFDPDIDKPVIVYSSTPIVISKVMPTVSVSFAFNQNDTVTLREILAKQLAPVLYTATDIDSNGDSAAHVNLYYVDASLIGATGEVTLSLLEDLAANGQYLGDNKGGIAADLNEDAANSGAIFNWDITHIPYGTYGIIATVTDRLITSIDDLAYATTSIALKVPEIRFPARIPGEEFQQTSPVSADLDGDGMPESAIISNSGYLLVFAGDGRRIVGIHLLPSSENGQIKSSLAAGDFDRTRPGVEMVVGAVGPSLLYIAADGVSLATSIVPLDTDALKPGVDSTPAVGDLNLDGELDIVVKLRTGLVVALAGDGRGGFTQMWTLQTADQTSSGLEGSPVIGNVKGDATPEVVIGTADGKIFVVDTLPGFAATMLFQAPDLDGVVPRVLCSPALFDSDGDGLDEIFTGFTSNLRGSFYGLNGDVTESADLSVVKRPGAPVDEVLAISDIPPLSPDRSLLPIRVSPAFGDVDGDSKPDLVFANEQYLYVYSLDAANATATLLLRYNAPSNRGFRQSSPLLADIDVSMGAQEIIIGSERELLVLSYHDGAVCSCGIMDLPELLDRLTFDFRGRGSIQTTLLIADAVHDVSNEVELVLVLDSGLGGLIDALQMFDGPVASNVNNSWPMLKGGAGRTGLFGDTDARHKVLYDLNSDGRLDYKDLMLLSVDYWSGTENGSSQSTTLREADLDKNGRVDQNDLIEFIGIRNKY
jgi:Matrixin